MEQRPSFDLRRTVRPAILSLRPYSSARNECSLNHARLFLDANENAYGPGLDLSAFHDDQTSEPLPRLLASLHRYPDPQQLELKASFCRLRNRPGAQGTNRLDPANVCLGSGSDEIISLIIQCFCTPEKDKIMICSPTYGMYKVSAEINSVKVVDVPLVSEQDWDLDQDKVAATLETVHDIKLLFLCSPGNPSGKSLDWATIKALLLLKNWHGLIVVDEAYIDFAKPSTSLASMVTDWPNLIVVQTLSKAFGLAGLRLGASFSSTEIAELLSKIKSPYNISSFTSYLGMLALRPHNTKIMEESKSNIEANKEFLRIQVPRIPGMGRHRGGCDANFLVFEVLDRPGQHGKPCSETARRLHRVLIEEKNIVIRFLGDKEFCNGCVRITVGSRGEVSELLSGLRSILSSFHSL